MHKRMFVLAEATANFGREALDAIWKARCPH